MDQVNTDGRRGLALDAGLLADMFEQAPGFMALLRGPDHVYELANPAYRSLLGGRDLVGKPLAEVAPEATAQGFADMFDEVRRTGKAFVGTAVEVQLLNREETVFVDFVAQPILSPSGEVDAIFVQGTDVTERTRAERLRAAQGRMLEAAFQDKSLSELLDLLMRTVEEQAHSQILGSVLLLDKDKKRLLHGAAPSLPDAYNEAIDGIEIGPKVGSCGAAAFSGEPVFVSDIATDPKWADFKDLALRHGLKACWSIPIVSSGGEVLGTFAMYHREPREPTDADIEVVDFVIRTAAVIIERKMAEQMLEEERRTLETLNRTGAEISAELNLEKAVQMVVDAGVELSGAAFGAFFYNVSDGEGGSYMLYALSGVERSAFENFPMPRATKIFAPTFEGEGPVRSDDITKDPRYGHNRPHHGMPEGHLPVISYLAVPVTSRSGNVIGGLFFGHPEPGRFSARHERLLLGIAGQAAAALDNAQLYRDAQQEIAARTEAQDALRRSRDEFTTLADNIPTLCWMAYADGHIFWYNRRWYDYTGTSAEDQEGWGWETVHDPDMLPKVVERWKHSLDKGEPFEMIFPLKGADGQFRPFLTRVVPIEDDSGNIVRWFGTNVDISEQVRTEEALAETVKVKDVLLHEVNHRVKNSLQVVTSLLTLQARKTDDEDLRNSLQEARNRVAVIAAMHQRLYATSDHDRVDFGDYLSDLTEEAMQSMGSSDRVRLRNEIDRGIVMDLSQAVPLALIVSELITNAIKYAYPPDTSGEVHVGLEDAGDRVKIRIGDDGIGLPEGFEPTSSDGLGMRIVTSLLRQVRGTLTVIDREPGVQFSIEVPLNAKDRTDG